jgi:hypothetical protein
VIVSLHPEADDEFAGAVAYYSEISPELGVRFYREMEHLLLEVQQILRDSGNLIRQRAGISATIFLTQSSLWTNQIMSASLR